MQEYFGKKVFLRELVLNLILDYLQKWVKNISKRIRAHLHGLRF